MLAHITATDTIGVSLPPFVVMGFKNADLADMRRMREIVVSYHPW